MIQVNTNGWASRLNCGVDDELLISIEGPRDEECITSMRVRSCRYDHEVVGIAKREAATA